MANSPGIQCLFALAVSFQYPTIFSYILIFNPKNVLIGLEADLHKGDCLYFQLLSSARPVSGISGIKPMLADIRMLLNFMMTHVLNFHIFPENTLGDKTKSCFFSKGKDFFP